MVRHISLHHQHSVWQSMTSFPERFPYLPSLSLSCSFPLSSSSLSCCLKKNLVLIEQMVIEFLKVSLTFRMVPLEIVIFFAFLIFFSSSIPSRSNRKQMTSWQVEKIDLMCSKWFSNILSKASASVWSSSRSASVNSEVSCMLTHLSQKHFGALYSSTC